MGISISGKARPAAIVAAVMFFVVAEFQVWWAAGGTWGLSAAWGGTYDELSAGLRVASAFSAAILVAGAAVLLGRVGYWAPPVPFKVIWWVTWVFVAILALSAVVNFASSSNLERFLNAPLALTAALLCLVVARSDNPHSLIEDGSPTR